MKKMFGENPELVDSEREIVEPEMPEKLERLFKAGLRMTFCETNKKNTAMTCEMYKDLKFVDADKVYKRLCKYKLLDEPISKPKSLISLVACESYVDAVFEDVVETFKEKVMVPKQDGVSNFEIISDELLDRVEMCINGCEQYMLFRGDLDLEESRKTGKFVYKFYWDWDKRERRDYIRKEVFNFPEFILPSPTSGCFFSVYTYPKEVECMIKYRQIFLDLTLRKNFCKALHILPLNEKKTKLIGLGSMWVPAIEFNLDKSYEAPDTLRLLNSIDDKYYNLDSHIKRAEIRNRRELIRQCDNIFSTSYGPSTIELIQASKNSFAFKIKELPPFMLMNHDKRYEIDIDRFVILNGKDVSFYGRNPPQEWNSVGFNNSFGGCSMGRCPEEEEFEDIQTKYPIAVLGGQFDNGGYIFNLLDGRVLRFLKEGEDIVARFEKDRESGEVLEILYSSNSPSDFQLYQRDFPGPYKTLGILCRRDCSKPDLDLFWDEEKDKSYVYFDGTEYLTMPPQVDYMIPEERYDEAIEILDREGGFNVHLHKE